MSLRAYSGSVSNSKAANSTAVHRERDKAFETARHEVEKYWTFVGHRIRDRM